MRVVYDSHSGMSKSFAKRLGYESIDVKEIENQRITGPLFLVTRNEGFGDIPKTTLNFLRLNYRQVVGVAVSSNPNWGPYYGQSGDSISTIYKIPLVLKFNGAGDSGDVEIVKKFLLSR